MRCYVIKRVSSVNYKCEIEMLSDWATEYLRQLLRKETVTKGRLDEDLFQIWTH